MHTAELDQQVVYEPCDQLLIRVNSCDQLGYNLQPNLHRRGRNTFIERFVDLLRVTVFEPECEQAQRVLQTIGFLIRRAQFYACQEALFWLVSSSIKFLNSL